MLASQQWLPRLWGIPGDKFKLVRTVATLEYFTALHLSSLLLKFHWGHSAELSKPGCLLY